MVNLDNLWKYSLMDMEAERFEAKMRKSPNRQKLLSIKNYLVEQQNNMKKIEAEINSMSERLGAIQADIDKQSKILNELTAELTDAENDSILELEGEIDETERLLNTFSKLEQDLRKIRKDADTRYKHQREILGNAAQKKAEYDKIKEVYDVEFKQDKEKLGKLKAQVEEASKTIEPELLAHYKSVRQHCVPPMAKLINGQCSGCNMSLPSAAMHRITDGNEIVECDNCGAILYFEG